MGSALDDLNAIKSLGFDIKEATLTKNSKSEDAANVVVDGIHPTPSSYDKHIKE